MSVDGENTLSTGVKAAKFSVIFPGFGQLQNRHYLRDVGHRIVSFVMAFQFRCWPDPPAQQGSVVSRSPCHSSPWELSI
jgi:hypothetical protein